MSSDLAAAMADTSVLGDFEGRKVIRSPMRITGAGDGLSEALAIDPRKLNVGDRVVFVMEGILTGVNHVVAKGYESDEPDAPLWRVQTVRAGAATIVDVNSSGDATTVEELLKVQKVRIQRARDEAAGTSDLGTTPGVDGWSDEDLAAGRQLRAVPNGDDEPGEDEGSPMYDDEDDPQD